MSTAVQEALLLQVETFRRVLRCAELSYANSKRRKLR